MSTGVWTPSAHLGFGMSLPLTWMTHQLFLPWWLDLGFAAPIVSCKGKPRLPFGVDGGYGFGRMPFLRDRLPREAWGKEGQGLPNLDS